ncbi:hypothetical protein HHL11_04160 [Ramlibacter sp. G-1-2-2]|uniref:Uncharacterized protein n=1 Tax=Ramlibacter agri TaxID=2728837 RepID=A0A848GZZ2_9BURK|nr:flagellar biosynthetic protein FliO [Ramlibacter agri]NML42932.1 hypothetical protein [Ramlibacter agri]
MDPRACRRRLAPWLLACGWALTASGHAQETVRAARVGASSVLPTTLPLRRGAADTPAAPPWLAASSVLLLAAAGGGLLVMRRQRWPWLRIARPDGGRPGLERISSQALTAQASLHAVRWNGEELLVACTAQQVTLLARRPASSAEGERA